MLDSIRIGKQKSAKQKLRKPVTQAGLFGLLTIFQLICLIRLLFSDRVMENPLHLLALVLLIGVEWVYYGFSRAIGREHIELEASAFFLTSIGFVSAWRSNWRLACRRFSGSNSSWLANRA